MKTEKMRVAIDSDDVGAGLKAVLYRHLKDRGVDIEDLAFSGTAEIAYPEIGYNLALRVQHGDFDRGILICGTGLGMAMIANKVEGIYAGTCHDAYSAERLRKSNDAQILTMGARVVGEELAKTIADAWLNSDFQRGGSEPKVRHMRELERLSFHPFEAIRKEVAI